MFYKKLKLLFPLLKIVLLQERKYKYPVLKYFDIPENDILLNLNTNYNICVLPYHEIYALDSIHKINLFGSIVNNIIDKIHITHTPKNIDFLLLPRHTIENNEFQQHVIDTTHIEKLFTNINNNKYVSLDTSTINNFSDQISYIQKSSYIVLPDGSSTIVNGICAYDSVIVCLGITTLIQSVTDTPKVKLILKKIIEHNKIIYVPISDKKIEPYQKYTFDMIKDILMSTDIETLENSYKIYKNIFIYQKQNIIDVNVYCKLFNDPV